MAKEFLKIWFSDIESANEFFDGNERHLGEFLVNVYRCYAELPLNFQCKLVAKYFKTYSKQIEFIKKAKIDGSKARLQDVDYQNNNSQTLEGVALGAVTIPHEPTLKAKYKGIKDKSKKLNNKDEFIVPTFDEFLDFCKEKGFEHIAKKAYDGYSVSNWKDSKGNKIKNWKQKLIHVWFDTTRNPKPLLIQNENKLVYIPGKPATK